jgi:hypothetical protein
MASLWSRLTSWGRREAVEREEAEEQMSPAERRFENESLEGHAADLDIQERFGGMPPLDIDDRPPRY